MTNFPQFGEVAASAMAHNARMAAPAASTTPTPDSVTITVAHVEAALRKYLAILDYDLHKGIECDEESGADTYPDEAADLFKHLRKAVDGAS